LARKILLADDSVTAQNMGRKILADAGYEVITVNNGSAALKKIGEQKPDLIVLDVYMPGYSGLEVCQRLKDVAETARIPILLTVGKLEPFKPEEAKRVRADGFIVKPFEASELLTALSKLEDKVVPRAESSKPGRFARATAAIEEARYDKSMAIEEDNGWKSRIVFPKKKEKPVEPAAEDPAAYNPVKKDRRTVVEDKREEMPSAPPQEAERVDLGALAPEGLPKDVTPEEIAALAAAAAQVKGKLAEARGPEPAAEMAIVAPAEVEAPKPEIKAEAQPAEPVLPPAPEVTPAVPGATFAEQETPEKIEAKEPEPEAAPSPAEVMAAIAGLETEAVQTADSENAPSSSRTAEKADEPVTMAVATPASAAPAVSRWTAVAVALAPEDAAISLEQEMQKVYSAYAAAEADRTAIFRIPEPPPAPPAAIEPAPAEAPAPAAADTALASHSTPAEVAPEAAESMSAVANAATDAISAAVAELESVAAAYAAEKAATPTETSAPELQPSTPEPSEAAAPAPAIPETPQIVEAKTEPAPVAETPEPPVPVAEAAEPAEKVQVEAVEEAAKVDSPQAAPAEPAIEESQEKAPVVEAPVAEAPAAAAVEVPEQASTNNISEEPAARVPNASNAGGTDDMAKRESETAAAWATWRKIRETGDSKSAHPEEYSKDSEETSAPKDAAMAVAVGAEHSPEEATTSAESDREISSIVDSVLADLRPKIVEEISRKLGKKK